MALNTRENDDFRNWNKFLVNTAKPAVHKYMDFIPIDCGCSCKTICWLTAGNEPLERARLVPFHIKEMDCNTQCGDRV